MNLIDFSNCEYSNRHGLYAGNAGGKDGLIYNGANWVIKYPKTTRSMSGKNLASYTTSPLSEYIGSHIYEILGYPVHETLLGYRNNKIVVACKDFQEFPWILAEVRSLKNAANNEVSRLSDTDLPESATGDSVVLEELLFHFRYNEFLSSKDVQNRFWDCAIIDILIDNNDRNNGNWGLLINQSTGKRKLAPVYDNGNSFCNKLADECITPEMMNNDVDIIGKRTVYQYKEHMLSAKKLLQLDVPELKESIIRVVPKMQSGLQDMINLIMEIPQSYRGLLVCSKVRKEFYIRSLQVRLEKLLMPVYQSLAGDNKTNIF